MAFSDQELAGMGRTALIDVIRGLEARLVSAEQAKKDDYTAWAKKQDELTEKLAEATGKKEEPVGENPATPIGGAQNA
jgi:hypothetical protein